MPLSPVNVIKEDPFYENLIYVGTDNGAYMSFNKGDSWDPFVSGLNKVAVHDIVIQSEKKDILLGTHGRSIYKTSLLDIYNYLDNISDSKDGIVFYIEDMNYCGKCGTKRNSWDNYIDSKLKFTLFSEKNLTTSLKLYENDVKIYESKINLEAGFQEMELDTYYSKKAIKSIYKNNKKSNLNETKSGKYYFRKGQYKLKIGDYLESFQIK